MKKRADEMNVGDNTGDKKIMSSITVMLLMVTFVFMGLVLPYAIFVFMYSQDLIPVTWFLNGRYRTMQIITEQLYYTNNALNFFLYFASGAHFRKALLSMVCFRREEKGKSGTRSLQTATTSIRSRRAEDSSCTSSEQKA